MIRMNFRVAIVFSVVIVVMCGPSEPNESPPEDYDYDDDYYYYYDYDSSPVSPEGPSEDEEDYVELPDWMDGDLDLDKLPMDKVSLLNSANNLMELAELFGLTKEHQDRLELEFEEEELNSDGLRTGDNEIVIDATIARCKPAQEIVELEVPPKTIYLPQCVRLQRCGGCCKGKLLSCQPTRTENVTLKVMELVSGRRRRRRDVNAKYVKVNQVNHMECSCQCRIQEQDCDKSIQDYNPSECACVCKNRNEEPTCNMKSAHYWDHISCTCRCRETQDCSTGEEFSQDTCRCVRSTRNSDTRIFNPNVFQATCVNGEHKCQCNCNNGWEGDSCDQPICNSGCDNAECVSPNTCKCKEGWQGNICQEPVCNPTCGNGGTCSAPNTCTCTSEWTGPACEQRCECILLESCEPLRHLLQDKTKQNKKILRAAICDYNNNNPKVWCPTIELPSFCGRPTFTEFRVYGGMEVPLGKYPWMALLGYKDLRDPNEIHYFCGGTVINERYVLTAAHCVSDTDLGSKQLHEVKLGEWDQSTEQDCDEDGGCIPKPLVFSPEKVIIHPDYNKRGKQSRHRKQSKRPKHCKHGKPCFISHSDDIAIIRLNATVNIQDSSFIRAVCLPPANMDTRHLAQSANSSNRMFHVAGWGVTEKGIQSSKLLEVELPLFDTSRCNNTYRGRIISGQLCVGGRRDEDSCQGDSGGPLILPGPNGPPYLQVGVVSWGGKCGQENSPGVYTEVSKYIHWIKQNLAI